MTNLIEKSAEFLTSTSDRAWKICGISTFCFAVIITAAMLSLRSHYVVNVFPCDLNAYFDAAWRIHSGQMPHTDFYCPLGAFLPFVFSFAMAAFPGVNGLIVAPLVVYIPFALALYFVGNDRLPALWMFILELFLGLCVVAPRPLGYPLSCLSPAMLYNRWGEAMVALVFLGVFFAPYRPLKLRKELGENFLIGILVALLLFLKISYFEVILLAVLWHVFFNRPGWARLCATTAGFTFIVLIFVLLGIHLPDMLADLHRVTAAQDWRLRGLQLVMKILGNCPKGYYAAEDWGCEGIFPYVEVMFILLFAAIVTCKRSKAYRWRIAMIALFIFASGWAFYTVNFQIGDPVVAALAPIFLFHCIWRSRSEESHATKGSDSSTLRNELLFLAGWCLSFCFAVIITTKDLITMAHADGAALKQELIPAQDQISGKMVAGMDWPASYAGYINSALGLVRANRVTEAKIIPFDFTNPFPFLLGAPPPRGPALFWFDNSFSLSHHQEPEAALGDAEVILVPTKVNMYNYAALDSMKKIYGPYLAHNFTRRAGNDSWDLFVRHPAK